MASSRTSSQEPSLIEKRCPFYGFHSVPAPCTINDNNKVVNGRRVYVENEGDNYCIFPSEKSEFRCELKQKGETPDWNKCPLNNPDSPEVIEKISARKIFPLSLKPKHPYYWTGISFKQWFEHIMKQLAEP